MSMATKSFDRRYFINACWPQRGAGASTPQHMRDVPQFSQQHMYVCMRVCDINTSEGYFHHVFRRGSVEKWQCESWGEQEGGVLLNLTSAEPEMALILPRNATCIRQRWRRQLTGANWQSQPYRLNNALPHTFHWVLILQRTTDQNKTRVLQPSSHDRKKARHRKETKATPKIIQKSTAELKSRSDNISKREQVELRWDFGNCVVPVNQHVNSFKLSVLDKSSTKWPRMP